MPEPGATPAAGGIGASAGAVASWAAYLACSWTWCIGMFLPVLLVRDFGLAGFLVFAAPNVLGAAAMGWVLRDARASERLLLEHATATRLFSIVTILFHAFFLAWLARSWWGVTLPAVGVALAAFTATTFLALAAPATQRRAGLALWVVTIASAATLLPAWLPDDALHATHGALPEGHALPLAAVCVLGFGLCPYLDLTFHRARRELSPGGARAAFGIGFGVLFLAMIVLTLLYRGAFLGEAGVSPRSLPLVLSSHLLVQSVYTAGVHLRELARHPAPEGVAPAGCAAACALFVAALVGALALGATVEPMQSVADASRLGSGEIAYRAFMSAYGLAFPAYVWVCVVPRGRWAVPPRVARRAWLGAVVAASPCLALGFLARETWWLVPGVGIVLVAPLVARALSSRR